MEQIDRAWLDAHPLPDHGKETDKNARGRVLLIGGAQFVPGGLRLTGEAVLRAGAGKLQMATVAPVATALGVLVPEAAMIALPADEEGEIALAAAARLADPVDFADTLVIGPGMSGSDTTEQLVRELLAHPREAMNVVLDAAAITSARSLRSTLARHAGRVVLTPHYGEMATLMALDIKDIGAAPRDHALEAARHFNAVVALKAAETIIAAPDGRCLTYASECIGLATGGSGDVLAGVIGGLMARGASPLVATAWSVWAHGQAGRQASDEIGPIGFLARELLVKLPSLLAGRP